MKTVIDQSLGDIGDLYSAYFERSVINDHPMGGPFFLTGVQDIEFAFKSVFNVIGV